MPEAAAAIWRWLTVFPLKTNAPDTNLLSSLFPLFAHRNGVGERIEPEGLVLRQTSRHSSHHYSLYILGSK